MSIKIGKKDDAITLKYTPRGGTSFIKEKFDAGEIFTLKRIFEFVKEDALETGESSYTFKIAELVEDYYKVASCILQDSTYTVYIQKDFSVDHKTFFAINGHKYYSVLKMLVDYVKKNVWIGGKKENALSEKVFEEFLRNIPNDCEMNRYFDAKITGILKDIFCEIDDNEYKFIKYVETKRENLRAALNQKEQKEFDKTIYDVEARKYKLIKDKIELWLNESEESHIEKDWQELVNEIILILYPKYVAVFREAPIEDPYKQTSAGHDTTRFLDYLLLDADGNCDIAEIKSPFEKCILSEQKYRDNYIPKRELSGAIMQVEKYVFYMNKKGFEAEKKLNNKYAKELPEKMEIKVTNPRGIIILGRSNGFNEDQKRDFEIIKRKYNHIVDILSYDDLLNRLDRIIKKFEKKVGYKLCI